MVIPSSPPSSYLEEEFLNVNDIDDVMSPFVVLVDGQQWDLSNLVSPPPPPMMELDFVEDDNDEDDEATCNSNRMVVTPSPNPRQRKHAPMRQSSLTTFKEKAYYDHQELLWADDVHPMEAPRRRRSRHEMEKTASCQSLVSSASHRVWDMEQEDDDDDDEEDDDMDLRYTTSYSYEDHAFRPAPSFDDCSSLSTGSVLPNHSRAAPRLPPNHTTTWIEVMPQQFLPLIGDSYATWHAIECNNVHHVTCMMCDTPQYCMTSISTVLCCQCRSLFPNPLFTASATTSTTQYNPPCSGECLGLGMPVEEAHRELERRKRRLKKQGSHRSRNSSSRGRMCGAGTSGPLWSKSTTARSNAN